MFLGANRVIWHGVRIEILHHWCEFEKHKKKFWPGNGALKRHLPYGKVKFQKHIFTNPMVDSDSSWKVCTQSVLHFQIFRSEVVQKLKKPLKLRVSLTYPQKMSFLLIWPTSSGNFKKIKVVCIHTFSRGIRICPQICNDMVLKIYLIIGHVGAIETGRKIFFISPNSMPYYSAVFYEHIENKPHGATLCPQHLY